MQMMIDKAGHAETRLRDVKARQYQRLYFSCFIVFLVVTAIDRILPGQWRFRHAESDAATADRKSIVEEAREQAGVFVPYLFMNL